MKENFDMVVTETERPAKKLRLSRQTLKTLESGTMGNSPMMAATKLPSTCPGCLTWSRNYCPPIGSPF